MFLNLEQARIGKWNIYMTYGQFATFARNNITLDIFFFRAVNLKTDEHIIICPHTYIRIHESLSITYLLLLHKQLNSYTSSHSHSTWTLITHYSYERSFEINYYFFFRKENKQIIHNC